MKISKFSSTKLDTTGILENIEKMTFDIQERQSREKANFEKIFSAMQEKHISELKEIKNKLVECKQQFSSDSIEEIENLRLKNALLSRKIESMDEQNTNLQLQIQNLKSENKVMKSDLEEKDRHLRCTICMESIRDTLLLPCMHFMFCQSCILQHNKTSNQCPSCRQVSSGLLVCKLEASAATPLLNRK